ncbi:MAG: DUF2092 domain-containing protein [Ardenticatenaceae bacterium]
MKRYLLLALIGLLLVACGPSGQPSAEEIVRRAEAAMEGLERAHAVVEVEATIEGESVRLLGEGWLAGDQKRGVVLEASEPNLVGIVAVSDGEQGWLYHPDKNIVLTGDLAALKAYQQEQVDSPEGMDLAGLTELVDELLRVTNQELVGSESIAGLDAWHLRLTPNEDAPREWVAAGGTVELWISQEYDVPLQVIYSGGAMGEGRVTVQQYDATAGFDEGIFDFAPPSGAEVVDVATLLPEHMTLTEARKEATFPLLSTPADSAEATLVALYRMKDAYVQEFEGTVGEWKLIQSPSLPEHLLEGTESARTESVTVRGHKAQLYSDAAEGRTIIVWREPDVFVTLIGQVSPETALALAEKLE